MNFSDDELIDLLIIWDRLAPHSPEFTDAELATIAVGQFAKDLEKPEDA